MPLSLVARVAADPITLALAKLQVQQGDPVDDTLLSEIIIPAARDRMEAETGRAGISQTWDLFLDAFPACEYIRLPKPPLQSVTYVKYYDLTGTLQTLTVNTGYVVQAPAGPKARSGRIGLPYATSWPTTLPQIGAVVIRFVCGYGDTPGDVPALLRAAMLLDIGTLYAERENVIRGAAVEMPSGARDIYWSYRAHPTERAA